MLVLALAGPWDLPFLAELRLIGSPLAALLLLGLIHRAAGRHRHPERRPLAAFGVLALFAALIPGSLAALAIAALRSLDAGAEPWGAWVTLVALNGLFALAVLAGWGYGVRRIARSPGSVLVPYSSEPELAESSETTVSSGGGQTAPRREAGIA